MILKNYKEKCSEREETTRRTITFDKVIVKIFGDRKYNKTEISFSPLPGVQEKDINAIEYVYATIDYLISHPAFKEYQGIHKNVFDRSYIRRINFSSLRISAGIFEIIMHTFPNLGGVYTEKCTILKSAIIGCLTCDYGDTSSDIESLNSFNGFKGEILRLNKSKIRNRNTQFLHLYCALLEFRETKIDMESFLLTTDAPNCRKLVYSSENEHLTLKHKDLLFIGNFYNLESIEIKALVDNYDLFNKLEKLREIKGVYVENKDFLEKVKRSRLKDYRELQEKGYNEKKLTLYLMIQGTQIKRASLNLLHELYVPRLERVALEAKMATKEIERIRKELIHIANLSILERRDIAREVKESTIFDSLNGLDFDFKKQEGEAVLVNSKPFETEGTDYYQQTSKKILIL